MRASADRADPRVVIVRPDHLGDVLLTLPAVAALRRALPDVHITLLVPPAVAEVPRHCPDVDATLTAPFPPLNQPAPPPDWRDRAVEEGAALRGRFDLAILPRPDDPWSGPLVATADIPLRLGYAMPRTLPFLTDALPAPGYCHAAVLGLRLVDAAAERLGLPDSKPPHAEKRHFVTTTDEEFEAQRLLDTVEREAGHAPIVLHPGSGWPVKNWPVQNWGRLAVALHQRFRVSPLVTGSRGERELVDAVVERSGGRACGIAGLLSLGGLAALYGRSRVVIGTDSGPLHLASMVGAPVVGLYGPADPNEFRPWCPPDRRQIVRFSLPCSPCRNLLDPPCGARTNPACVTGIGVEAVLAAVEVLQGTGNRE